MSKTLSHLVKRCKFAYSIHIIIHILKGNFMKKIKLTLALSLCVLGLSACGEDYQMVLVDDYFPYGNQRTAGSGVAYVRMKMAPARPLNIKVEDKTVKEEIIIKEKVIIEKQPMIEQNIEPVFRDAQKK